MTKQSSRQQGVPRSIPLWGWKEIASRLIDGPEPSRRERQAGAPSKVQACRDMTAGNKEFKKRVLALWAEIKAQKTQAMLDSRGWKLNETDAPGFVERFPGDRPDLPLGARQLAALMTAMRKGQVPINPTDEQVEAFFRQVGLSDQEQA